MNHYGHKARGYWQANAPSRYAELDDPDRYFADLGEQALMQIEQISQHLEADLPPEMPYLERVGQLRAIQRQAEEIAMADLAYWVPVEASDAREELDEMLGQLPGVTETDAALGQIQENAWMEAGMPDDEQTVILDEQQEADREALLRLRPLVDLSVAQQEALTETEAAALVQKLRPWMADNPAEPGWHAFCHPVRPI